MPRRSSIAASSPVLDAAQRLVGQIEALTEEMAALRTDNESLRAEVQTAVSLMDRANTALDSARTLRPGARAADVRRGRPRNAKVAKGRATPAAVTPDVVTAVLAKLGEATAAEIAKEINAARVAAGLGSGDSVSGRAVRFIAERAGAHAATGDDGRRRYRL